MTATATLTEKKPRKVIFERLFTPEKVVIEERKAGETTPQRMHVEGLVSKAGETTGNHRRYGRPIFERHIGDKNSPFMKRVREKKVLGCLEHPEEDASLEHVSHLVEDCWMDAEGGVHAKFLIFNEGKGKILRELFECGVPVGSSSRGEGSTTLADDGITEDVDEDYELETWDFVHTPALDSARAHPVKESKESGKELGAMKEALEKARKTIGEAEAKNLSTLEVPELATLHISIVEAMAALASATEAESIEVRGRLAGLGSQVSKALSEKAKTKDQKVVEQINAQYPDAMAGISALVESLVKQNEKLQAQMKETAGEEGTATQRKLEAAMTAGEELVKRVRKLMGENQVLTKKYGIAVRTLDKVMEAVKAKGLRKQVETLCGEIPQLRHVQSELLQAKTSKELEEKVKLFTKLIGEKKESHPEPKKTAESRPSNSREPLPPQNTRKGKQLDEDAAPSTRKSKSLFGRLHERGL